VECYLPKGEDAPWNASAPEPSWRPTSKFCAYAHGDSRFCELLSLLVV